MQGEFVNGVAVFSTKTSFSLRQQSLFALSRLSCMEVSESRFRQEHFDYPPAACRANSCTLLSLFCTLRNLLLSGKFWWYRGGFVAEKKAAIPRHLLIV